MPRRGLSISRSSAPHLPCLKQLGAEGDRMARAEALIVEETLRNPLHLRFWDRELATYY